MTCSLTSGFLSATIGVALVMHGEARVNRPAAGPGQDQAPHTRAAELIGRGRSAIGPIGSLKSLSGVGTRRSMVSFSSGKEAPYEVHFILPDRFVQLVTSLSSTNEIHTIVFGFNGATALSGLRTTQTMLSGVPEANPTLEQRLFARLLLGWFLTAPSYLPVEYAYQGEAATPEGQKAFVVDAKGPDDFAVRLFLDETTCRPLMLTYKTVARGAAGPPPSGARSGQTGKTTSAGVAPAVGETVATTYFSDVRSAGPFHIAHTVIDARDGKTTQELRFSKITANPDLKPSLFANR